MANVTKEIMQRMLMEQAQQGMAQNGQQPQGQQVDPQLDMIAKKMALLKGKPEDKYMIFIKLLPQLLKEFSTSKAGEAEGADPREGYDVVDNFGQAYPREGMGGAAMPPPQGSSEGRF
jgi:hypothetical protein